MRWFWFFGALIATALIGFSAGLASQAGALGWAASKAKAVLAGLAA